METLGIPSREIRKRFTKSDIAIMAWRSAETSANMKNNTAKRVSLPSQLDGGSALSDKSAFDERLRQIEENLGPIAIKMVNQQGQIDLRKLTGAEAASYFRAMGIPLMSFGR